jgi:glycosyltransferase involved in cell wall biosynthesis
MDCSVIIPTLNRPEELEIAIKSILEQTIVPNEIVIVDQGSFHETAKMLREFENWQSFKKKPVFKHIKLSIKSLTAARNVGVSQAISEIILFLDDDVILYRDFISNIMSVYEQHPNALGVQGLIIGAEYSSKLAHCVSRIFYLYYMEKNTWKVLPSGFNTYPYPLTREINCQS